MFLKETLPGIAFVGCPESDFFLGIRKDRRVWFKEEKTRPGVRRRGWFCVEEIWRERNRIGIRMRIRRYKDLKVRISKASGEILIFNITFSIRDQ